MTLDEWQCDACRRREWPESTLRFCEMGRMTQVMYRDGKCISYGSTCPWKVVMDARRAGARTYGRLLTERPDVRAFVERVHAQ